MELEYFKKELNKIKQDKLDAAEKAKKEYEEIYEQTVEGIQDLVEKLIPYIEYATKEFNLSDHIKEIENVAPYAFTATIRWHKSLDEAHFIFTGCSTTFSFSLNSLSNKNTVLSKHQLILIKNAFNPDNLDHFVKNLLKKLEQNTIYIGNQH